MDDAHTPTTRGRPTEMKTLTPEEIRDQQGAWVREQCRTESRIENQIQARNKKIQRNAEKVYRKSAHRAITANDPADQQD